MRLPRLRMSALKLGLSPIRQVRLSGRNRHCKPSAASPQVGSRQAVSACGTIGFTNGDGVLQPWPARKNESNIINKLFLKDSIVRLRSLSIAGCPLCVVHCLLSMPIVLRLGASGSGLALRQDGFAKTISTNYPLAMRFFNQP
jgi:hypothetical protein